MSITIDRTRFLADFAALAQIGRTEAGEMHRVAYSPTDQAGRDWVIEQMQALGMQVRIDQAGNTIATYPGSEDRPALALGSHTDSVPYGGSYDGALGIVAALACVRAIHTTGIQLKHPLEIINFAAEEATMAGGTSGSQAMAGLFNPAILDKPAWDSKPVREHLTAAGLDPDQFCQAKREPGSLAAYLELHIEQGEILPAHNAQVGIVEGFVGIRRYSVVVHGQANHAGTTPMNQRNDALVTAAPLIEYVQRSAINHSIVGTIGSWGVFPGAPNVIPQRVECVIEIRGLDSSILDTVESELEHYVNTLGHTDWSVIIRKPPVQAQAHMIAAVMSACAAEDVPFHRMPSGAGHDAMCMASICPQTMIFVPSKDGISHAPEEYTTPNDCIIGAEILLASLLKLEEML